MFSSYGTNKSKALTYNLFTICVNTNDCSAFRHLPNSVHNWSCVEHNTVLRMLKEVSL